MTELDTQPYAATVRAADVATIPAAVALGRDPLAVWSDAMQNPRISASEAHRMWNVAVKKLLTTAKNGTDESF